MSFAPMDLTVAAHLQLDAPLRQDSLLVFYRTVSALLKAGHPSAEAFRLAGEYSPDPNMKSTALGVYDELARRGKSLPEAIVKYPNMFSDLNKGLIATGDRTGTLDRVFLKIAEAEESLDQTRRRLILALIYPAVVLLGVLLLLVLSPRLFVNPIRHFCSDLGLPLPLLSRAVFAVSDALAWPGLWLALLLLAGLLRARWELIFRSDRLRCRLYRLCYRLPPVARVLRALTQAHWARLISLQLEAGTTLTSALATIKPSLPDPVFRETCQQLIAALEGQGCSLAEAMQQSRQFDPLAIAVVAVGEESGSLPSLLDFLARTYQEEFRLRLDLFEQLISPALMLLVGLIAGTWTLAILLPLAEMVSSLG